MCSICRITVPQFPLGTLQKDRSVGNPSTHGGPAAAPHHGRATPAASPRACGGSSAMAGGGSGVAGAHPSPSPHASRDGTGTFPAKKNLGFIRRIGSVTAARRRGLGTTQPLGLGWGRPWSPGTAKWAQGTQGGVALRSWLFIDGGRGRRNEGQPSLCVCSHGGGGRSPLVPSSIKWEKMPGGSVWVLVLALALPSNGQQHLEEAKRIMTTTPVIDGCPCPPAGVREAFRSGKVASLIGVEGGHSIDSSLGILRTLYRLGARYMTLTHSCNTPWADNWLVDTKEEKPVHHGLSPFGKRVVEEMNRLGMIVDLAHVSVDTMKVVLNISKAPVIFSHSSAYSICPHRRNVPDDVLRLVASTGSLVMVNFYNAYVTCSGTATLSDVADHMDYVKKVAGAKAVGFGGDYDGVPGVPTGLEDVSKYPALVAELLARNWTEEEVKWALAENLLRVFSKVEEGKKSLQGTAALEMPIAFEELEGTCRTSYGYSKATTAAAIRSQCWTRVLTGPNWKPGPG
ncbi:PREDICTED: LOW QUALITY PROTEIN: dipeptidase 1 [Corvus brachyrhynchos]|nr:PREDICTED: LOW QUALITY PROTEIN: dipeptidase 1 [Corvus brachyrhynchos]